MGVQARLCGVFFVIENQVTLDPEVAGYTTKLWLPYCFPRLGVIIPALRPINHCHTQPQGVLLGTFGKSDLRGTRQASMVPQRRSQVGRLFKMYYSQRKLGLQDSSRDSHLLYVLSSQNASCTYFP